MNIKTYKVSIHSSEIVDLLDGLPKGMRTPVIESALNMYMKSDSGRGFLNHFGINHRNISTRKVSPIPEKTDLKDKRPKVWDQEGTKHKGSKNFVNKFKGDFQ